MNVRVGIFVLLFLGVTGFGAAMFQASPVDPTTVAPGSSEATKPREETPPVEAALSREARTILTGAAADPSGLVAFERFGESVDLYTNGVTLFTDKGNHRELVAWEAAIEELIEQKLLVALGDRRELFEITKKGYDVAARLE